MLRGFSGGVHPPENKFTEARAIKVMPSPKRVYIHFSQHTGKPARPLVEKGDVVKIGTKIGEGDGFISASVHASISGKVVALESCPHPVLGSSLYVKKRIIGDYKRVRHSRSWWCCFSNPCEIISSFR
jgi:Na+-translocating ferredoxin:NAD+ oxidoreductase RnfC subunit